MALDKCNDAIAAALGRELTANESRIVKARAVELANKIKLSRDPASLDITLQKFADEIEFNRALQKRSTAMNYIAFAKAEAWRKNTSYALKDPAGAFIGFNRGSIQDFEGSKDSLAVNVQREGDSRSGALMADLEKGGLKKYAFSGADDLNITKAWSDIKNGIEPDPAKYGKNAVAVAQIVDKHLEDIRQAQNKAGAWISRQSDRLWRRTHDANKIAKAGDNDYGSDEARDYWTNSVDQKMNWDKAFDGEYQFATQNVRDTVLHGLWRSFKDNDHYKPGEAHPPVGLGAKSVAKKLSHGRQLMFNKPEDEFAYNQEFGVGSSLADNVYSNLRGGGRDLALMEKLGTNPEATYDKFGKSWLNDVEGDPKYTGAQRKQLRDTIIDEKANTWRLLTEGSGHPADNFVARFSQNVRSVTNTAALGMSVFKLPNDLNIRARMIAQRTGDSYYKNLLSMGTSMIPFMGEHVSAADRQHFFAELGIRTEGVNMPLDPNATDSLGVGRIAKFDQQVMSYTGHAWWDNKFRLNALVADGYRHWTQRDLSFDQLKLQQQNAFKQFGIDKSSWDIIRSSDGTKLDSGRSVFMPSDIASMPLDRFKSLVTDKNSNAQLSRARDDLQNKYRNYMGELADRGTSAPSIANKAFMGMGYKEYNQGTVKGELYRGAFALKGWAMNYLRNHLGDELYGYSNQPATFGQAMADVLKGKNPQGVLGLAKLISSGLLIAAGTNALHDLASGKTPENPLTSDGFERAMASGSLGIYADFLLQDTNPDAKFFDKVGQMGGPEFGVVSDSFNLASTLAHQLVSEGGITPEQIGRDEQELFANAYRRVPGTSLFWTKAAMDYAVLNNISEMLNPGYQQRLIDNASKKGQGFLAGAPGPQTNGQ